MKNKSRAFTLIELLVVVLIIGVLAAVALPQYRVAVLKSKYTALPVNVRNIMNGLEEYYLANGAYPSNLEQVTLAEISGCRVSGQGVLCSNADYFYYRDFNWNEYLVQAMFKNYGGLAYQEHTSRFNTRQNTAGKRYCLADSGNSAANQVCQSLGGRFSKTSNFYAQNIYSYTHNDWNKYELP